MGVKSEGKLHLGRVVVKIEGKLHLGRVGS
jgi:hypothetical protein